MNSEQERIYYNRAKNATNVLKGIAIWMIITCHFFEKIVLSRYVKGITNSMQLGFQVFFVLSCFSLCLSYRKENLTYWEFFKKKVLKLFFSYYIMIIIMIIYRVALALDSGTSILTAVNIKGVIINALLLNSFAPNDVIRNEIVRGGWFIGTLFILYLLFPFLFKLFRTKNRKWRKHRHILFPLAVIATSTIIICLMSLILGDFGNNSDFIYQSLINQICPFSFGFVLYHIFRTNKFNKIKFPLIKAMLCAGCAFLLSLAYSSCMYVIVVSLVGLATIFLFAFLFSNHYTKERLDSLFIFKFLVQSGIISMGIFYTHTFLTEDLTIYLLGKIYGIVNSLNILIKLFIGILVYVLCYFVGLLFYYFIEKTQNPLLDRFLD